MAKKVWGYGAKKDYTIDDVIKKIKDDAKSRGLFMQVYEIKMPENDPFCERWTLTYNTSIEPFE